MLVWVPLVARDAGVAAEFEHCFAGGISSSLLVSLLKGARLRVICPLVLALVAGVLCRLAVTLPQEFCLLE